MQKIRLSTTAWLFIGCVVLSVLAYFLVDSTFAESSPFTKQSTQMIEIIWFMYVFWFAGVTLIQMLSPQVFTCQGHYSYQPRQLDILKMPKNNAGKQPCPDIGFIGVGGFMAMGGYYGGKGGKGWDLWWDIPGMAIKMSDNLAIQSQSRICFVGREAHMKLWFIYDMLKDHCDSKGLILTDDTPIWLNFVPMEHITVPEQYKEMLMDFIDICKKYGANEAFYKDNIKERDIEDEGRRQKLGGKTWSTQPAPKDVQEQNDNRPNQPGPVSYTHLTLPTILLV